jgi:hypothetical protein
MIAVTHPGKMGDTLFALPLARLLYGITGEKIDFYTSDYCAPLKNLIQFQSYVNEVFVGYGDYKIERMDMGCQPWKMPVKDGYSQVYHAGFRGIPDRSIHNFIASQAGFEGNLGISYDVPESSHTGEDYIVIAPRGETSYKQLFIDVANAHGNALIIGGKGDYIGAGYDLTGLDMLETLTFLAHAKGFLGLMSSQLVLANGFNYPKIAPHDGRSWDMRHIVNSSSNFYPINPTVSQVMELLDKT